MNLLASDFDNTLWFGDHMKEDDVKAIHQFQKEGHLFGVCTGRTLSGINDPSQPYGLKYDFYILLSGALILNKDKEIIFERKIPMAIVKEIYEFMEHQNISIVYQDIMYKVYQTKRNENYGVLLNSIDDLQVDKVSAFSFHYSLDELDQAQIATQRINEKYGDIIEAYQNNQHIDLAAKGCSKGNGIKMIQDYFHLDMQHIYGIGDSWNDLPMFNAIEKSYSFTYAPKLVQQHAKTIVKNLTDCIIDIKNKD